MGEGGICKEGYQQPPGATLLHGAVNEQQVKLKKAVINIWQGAACIEWRLD